MSLSRTYFQDKAVLLLLSVNFFLTFLAIILILLRLTSSSNAAYITQYRADIVINPFAPGTLVDILAFIVFAVIVFLFHVTLSIKTYNLRRQLSITLLSMGVLLLITTIIISNALLALP